jgi:hypothetical protein
MHQVFVVLLAVLMFVGSPVLIPLAFASVARDRRRMLAIAERTACTRCGALLGAASMERADREWEAHVAALQRDRPGVRFRPKPRHLFAVCECCGARYDFDRENRAFTPLDREF